MAGNRNARINEEIMKCLAEILPTVKDPRLQGCMLSVLRCETTPDLRWCKVFISVLGQYNEKELKQGFKSVSGFIRRQLAQMLTVRYTPELVFVIDDSISYGAHISKLLNDLDIKHDDDESEEAEDEDLF
ncbi:MAG: 30S ribosome-binding factor RbfA [Clostridia bacterium]|nr:30S ribosome-binding factor RbfA [Clostridia bacterium]MBQ2326597.1 30S ribosome-binding factor RbfA [Clostridia bacterium]MBQ2690926.1 30S ribosome-binding factor RbfA [Clostridia bacterium]MBQ3062549.1 30S ribosome-binding factor RbfA [Clostridia bacterium]MBQ5813230.1 30S ribosome-binding factor RbfA [Clostridia bacterium]